MATLIWICRRFLSVAWRHTHYSGAGWDAPSRSSGSFVGYYETVLQRDELIIFVDVPAQQGWSSAYFKCTTRLPTTGRPGAALLPAKGRQYGSRCEVDGERSDRKLMRLPAAEAELAGSDAF